MTTKTMFIIWIVYNVIGLILSCLVVLSRLEKVRGKNYGFTQILVINLLHAFLWPLAFPILMFYIQKHK